MVACFPTISVISDTKLTNKEKAVVVASFPSAIKGFSVLFVSLRSSSIKGVFSFCTSELLILLSVSPFTSREVLTSPVPDPSGSADTDGLEASKDSVVTLSVTRVFKVVSLSLVIVGLEEIVDDTPLLGATLVLVLEVSELLVSVELLES